MVGNEISPNRPLRSSHISLLELLFWIQCLKSSWRRRHVERGTTETNTEQFSARILADRLGWRHPWNNHPLVKYLVRKGARIDEDHQRVGGREVSVWSRGDLGECVSVISHSKNSSFFPAQSCKTLSPQTDYNSQDTIISRCLSSAGRPKTGSLNDSPLPLLLIISEAFTWS